MTELIHLTIPFVGRIYVQHDTITSKRYSSEMLRPSCGRELLLCCGRLRLYITPSSSLANEGKAPVLGGADTR